MYIYIYSIGCGVEKKKEKNIKKYSTGYKGVTYNSFFKEILNLITFIIVYFGRPNKLHDIALARNTKII